MNFAPLRFLRKFPLLVLLVGCAAPTEAEEAETQEQGLVELDPILGHLEDTTPGPDFHAEELVPAQFPFAWSGLPFPKSQAVPATLGAPVTLSSNLGRVAAYGFPTGAEVEICASSPNAKAKLWLVTTTERLSNYCNGFRCNDPAELDETPRAKNDGDAVCTRGRIPKDAWGPHYVVVDLGAGSAGKVATVTTRAIKLRDKAPSNTGAFDPTSCQGPKITVADVEAKGLSLGKTSPSLGTYSTAARTRSCNRFRGCTPYLPADTAQLSLNGTCSGCIPRTWSNGAASGTIHVQWNNVSFGPYAKVLMFPAGAAPTVWTNHVSCDLSLTALSSCMAEGNWTNTITFGGTTLGFANAKESAFTKSCVRTVARTLRPKLHAEHEDLEVVFAGAINW